MIWSWAGKNMRVVFAQNTVHNDPHITNYSGY
jgi:hypothetical protein